jgi:hypothetical protein
LRHSVYVVLHDDSVYVLLLHNDGRVIDVGEG